METYILVLMIFWNSPETTTIEFTSETTCEIAAEYLRQGTGRREVYCFKK